MNNPKKNPFIQGKSKEERKQAMFERLSTPAIQNRSPDYHRPSVTVAETDKKQLITVTLDKLRPYEGNPRKTKNPAYEEIKASIKARGLDHAPNITQRPGEDFYTIADGGNTRLQALQELFRETQDPRFWSIDCIFKPWQGEANDINSQLNMLIGHLAENDLRGELSFIEKALGIRQVKALYEEKYQEFFSHRKLAEKLGENGYPISNQLIARMEQCLTYLYPHIPNVLMLGFGKAQIEKVLHIQRNAQTAWEKYQAEYTPTTSFDEVWLHTLSPFDEQPDEFSIPVFQDELLGKICEAFNYQVDYDTLKSEIDLEERKLKRLMEKQPEIVQRVTESEIRVNEIEEAQQVKSSVAEHKQVMKTESPATTIKNRVTSDDDNLAAVSADIDDDDTEISSLPTLVDMSCVGDNALDSLVEQHFAGFGMTPGVNPDAQRAKEAEQNDLSFANIGKCPITNLWKIYPNRQHRMDAFSLALEIAGEIGIDHLIQHAIHEPVDYRFEVLPLDITQPSQLVVTIHALLGLLATEQLENSERKAEITLTSALLFGGLETSPEISDLLLVRLFRLIRLIRYIQTQHHLSSTT